MNDRDKQAEYKFYFREALAAVLKYAIRNNGMYGNAFLLNKLKKNPVGFYINSLKTSNEVIYLIRNLLKDKICLDDGVEHSLYDDLLDFSDFTDEEKKDLYETHEEENLHYIDGQLQRSK